MAQTTLGSDIINTIGDLPQVGAPAPKFTLTNVDLQDVSLETYAGKSIILNIFPSVDTGVCATSVREFNKLASGLDNTTVLCISRDLPFAFKRFCGAEGIENVATLSDFRSPSFGTDYGVLLTDGAIRGVFARAIVVIDATRTVKYTELVPTIGQEPNYDAALAAI